MSQVCIQSDMPKNPLPKNFVCFSLAPSSSQHHSLFYFLKRFDFGMENPSTVAYIRAEK